MPIVPPGAMESLCRIVLAKHQAAGHLTKAALGRLQRVAGDLTPLLTASRAPHHFTEWLVMALDTASLGAWGLPKDAALNCFLTLNKLVYAVQLAAPFFTACFGCGFVSLETQFFMLLA